MGDTSQGASVTHDISTGSGKSMEVKEEKMPVVEVYLSADRNGEQKRTEWRSES